MKEQQIVTVIGAGVIGLCWTALFAAKGYRVQVYDPREDLDEQLTHILPTYIQQIPELNKDITEICQRVTHTNNLQAAVANSIVVQESGPEQPEFKQTLWQQIEPLVAPTTLLLSSSSGIIASDQGANMRHGERIMIGHPFNPPHILPLVEVCADRHTPDSLICKAMDFYQRLGKVPVRLNCEKPAFVANRLQIALVLEAIKLVNEGVVGVRELDTIVTHSLGIRWASVGPLLAFHLGGGDGGIQHLLKHIGISLATDIGQPGILTDTTIANIAQQTEQVYPQEQFDTFRQARDRRQQLIISDQQHHPDV